MKQESSCIFCKPLEVVVESALSVAIFDAFPVTPLHMLVIPRRHVLRMEELQEDEIKDLLQLAQHAKRKLEERDSSINGFNFGINEGLTAGQTVFHLHLHVIPRRTGDHPNPRGGVRGVFPAKADYGGG